MIFLPRKNFLLYSMCADDNNTLVSIPVIIIIVPGIYSRLSFLVTVSRCLPGEIVKLMVSNLELRKFSLWAANLCTKKHFGKRSCALSLSNESCQL